MANSYLNRTTGSPTNSYKCTFSAWFKKSKTGGNNQQLISEYTDSNNRTYIGFNSSNQFQFGSYQSSSWVNDFYFSRLFTDVSAFYNFVIAIDTTLSTASDRVKIYINGVLETSVAGSPTYFSQNSSVALNSASKSLQIGAINGSDNFDGYMSHVAFVDGQALAPTVFGETDSTSGIWKFKSPSGVTWGTNGFHLKFENSGNLGLDSTGNSNTFTVNGNGRQALDTPSNVHCTFNPLIITSAGGVAVRTPGFQDGNTTALFDDSGNNEFALTTIAPSKGKWYAEFKWANATGNAASTVGIVKSDFVLQTDVNDQGIVYKGDGNKVVNNSSSSYGASWTTGDIIGIALDCDSNTVNFYKNSVAQGSISIDADTNWYIFCSSYALSSTTRSVNANFGNGYFGTTAISSAGSNGNGSLFEYDVPSGYYALNTKNINTYG